MDQRRRNSKSASYNDTECDYMPQIFQLLHDNKGKLFVKVELVFSLYSLRSCANCCSQGTESIGKNYDRIWALCVVLDSS